MTKTKAKVATKRRQTQIMVVYGFGENKKPRAAKFPESEFELARKAAELMGLSVYEGDAAKERQSLKRLPTGRIYASGWGFVPYIRRNQFDALVAKLNGVKSEAKEAVGDIGLPVSWKTIGISHRILAQADSASDGWWTCDVIGIDGDMLVLRAVQFPEVQVVRHRNSVALFFTEDFVTPEPSESGPPGLPASWGLFAANHLIIAPEGKPQDGFWEAIVVEVDGDRLTLQWRDYPRQPKFQRPRHSVALLNSASPSKN